MRAKENNLKPRLDLKQIFFEILRVLFFLVFLFFCALSIYEAREFHNRKLMVRQPVLVEEIDVAVPLSFAEINSNMLAMPQSEEVQHAVS